MAKKLNLTMFMFIILLFSSNLKAGELTFGWNKINENGAIYDMEFMPDNNYFVFVDYKSLQVRNTETGELVNNYPIPELFAAHNIEFTPDSTRMIFAYGDKLELRNVGDMSIIKEHRIPEGTDTAGYNIYESNIRFYEIVVDPVRPYVYAVRNRSGYLDGGKYFLIRKIVIYNYETMEEVGVLTTKEEENITFEKMAISRDGKYLAINNSLASHLRIWDLNTRQQIRAFKLCEKSGDPTCTKFSELNTGLIYFSGKFPLSFGNYNYNGLFSFNIQENRIVDSTFGVPPNFVYQGYFTLFDNEERAIKLIDNFIAILNLKNKIIEQKINRDTIANGPVLFGRSIYSNNKKVFLGFGNEFFSYCKNNLNTGTEDPIHYDSIIYPNPNTGIVSLQTECQNPIQSYEVSDLNGIVLIPDARILAQSGNITIDISALPAGAYLLRYKCGSVTKTYKINKEN